MRVSCCCYATVILKLTWREKTVRSTILISAALFFINPSNLPDYFLLPRTFYISNSSNIDVGTSLWKVASLCELSGYFPGIFSILLWLCLYAAFESSYGRLAIRVDTTLHYPLDIM